MHTRTTCATVHRHHNGPILAQNAKSPPMTCPVFPRTFHHAPQACFKYPGPVLRSVRLPDMN
eukprot:1159924-Pelagomonas_calceolata.AAC.5